MAVDIQETSYAESISQRNRCIVYAICKHLSLDPKNFLSEITGSCGIGNIVKKILNSSEEDASSSKNQDEVTKWANFASNISDQTAICHETLKDLNEELAQKSVLLRGLSPSVVDVIVFSALHDFVSQLSNEEVQKYSNVIRWIDYIQNKEDFGGAFDIIVVKKPQFEHFSSVETLNANQTNKKMVLPLKCAEKSDGNLDVNKGFTESSVDTLNANQTNEKMVLPLKCAEKSDGNLDVNKGLTEEKTPVTEKASLDSNKFKGVDVKSAIELTKKNAQSSEKGTECSVTLLNLQVGRILKAWKHPSADSLLVEMIDLGDGNQRQVVSGLAKYYSPEDLANRLVVLITNVKPGKLRDVMSSGLVLCASNKEQTTVETVTPPEGAKIGERISFSGLEGKPEDVLNPKKKQLDKITPHLYTDDKGVATYKGIPFMTSAGPCTSSLPNANIK